MQFAKVLVALAAGAAAFTAPTASKVSKVVVRGENPNEDGKLGAGGMADTRDPTPFVNESDKRQSISQAPSFEVRDARARARARARDTHRTMPFTATATPRRTGVPQAAPVNTPSRIALHLALYDAGTHTRPAVCRSALGGKGGRA